MYQAFIWSSVEPNIGIVCACMPTFRPLIRRWLPKWFGGGSSEYGTSHSRQRSQTGDFYALRNRKKDAYNGKYDDELGLTNNFKLGRYRALGASQDSTEDVIAVDTQNSILVKRDID